MNEEKRIIDEALKDVVGGSVAGEFGPADKDIPNIVIER